MNPSRSLTLKLLAVVVPVGAQGAQQEAAQ